MARIRSETLKELLLRVLKTRPEEVGCETCYEKLEHFVEVELEGKDTAQALPLIKRHLELCEGCNDEYTALLAALKQMPPDEPVASP